MRSMKTLKYVVEARYPGASWIVVAAFKYDVDADDFVRDAKIRNEPFRDSKEDFVEYRRRDS